MPIDLHWDHNAWYQARLLRALPDATERGARRRVRRRLVRNSPGVSAHRHVDAIDRAPHMVALARESCSAERRCARRGRDHRASSGRAITTPSQASASCTISNSSQVLPRLAETLRPGGLLMAVALPKIDLPRDLPIEALSAVGHRLLGAAFRLEQTVTGRRRYAHEASVRVMPMQDPVLTTRQVLAQAAGVLPNVRVRRLPFWRYELRWQLRPVCRCADYHRGRTSRSTHELSGICSSDIGWDGPTLRRVEEK